jgi:hypothetical protein
MTAGAAFDAFSCRFLVSSVGTRRRFNSCMYAQSPWWRLLRGVPECPLSQRQLLGGGDCVLVPAPALGFCNCVAVVRCLHQAPPPLLSISEVCREEGHFNLLRILLPFISVSRLHYNQAHHLPSRRLNAWAVHHGGFRYSATWAYCI